MTHWLYGFKTYLLSIGAGDLDFVLLTRLDSRGAILQGWQRQRENAELVLSRMELISVPVIEIAKLHMHQEKIKDLDFENWLPDGTVSEPNRI